MSNPRQSIPTALTLTIGLALGWALSNQRPTVARAGGGDRYGDYSLTTGAITTQYDERTKTQGSLEAIYFLDYKGGRLVATVPIQQKTIQGTKMIDGFADRDLVADFKVEGDVNPHFLMTVGSLGAYSEGWAPLFVFETTSKQMAVYRLNQSQSTGKKSASSNFELLEMKSYAALPKLPGQIP